jgi:hypothetical protein
MVYLVDIGRFCCKTYGYIHGPLAMNPEFNGTDRTYSSAFTAQGAFLFIPQDPPQKITGA